MPRILLIFCKLASLWNGGDYGFRQKLQNLLFPHGVYFDKKTGNYRTMYVNIIAERIAAMSATYSDTHKKRDCDFTHQSLDVEGTQSLSNEFVRQYIGLICFIDTNLAVFGVLG